MLFIGNSSLGSIAPIGDTTRWILNEDPVKVMGVVYKWDDTKTWSDVNIFKA